MILYIAICQYARGGCFTVNDGWQRTEELAIEAAKRHSLLKAGIASIIRIEQKESDQ